MHPAFTMTKTPTDEQKQIWIMPIVFCVSLLAVSFPSLSDRTSFLSIPRVVFFVGKHFGTGVILSTAFVHLLKDAFTSLNDVEGVGDWTGLIVLGSLLTIFCIEYVSLVYASRLDADNLYHDHHHNDHSHHVDLEAAHANHSAPNHKRNTDERTPLVHHHSHSRTYSRSAARPRSSSIFEGHHRFEHHDDHASHRRLPRFSWFLSAQPEEANGHINTDPNAQSTSSPECFGEEHEWDDSQGQEEETATPIRERSDSINSGRQQVVGIMVLQLGIMIHSFVIGLTLSVSDGPELTSLLTAITFHQLFEGLSLGTRITALPSSSKSLQSVLAVTFAITVPIGIITGLCTLKDETEKMKLIEGTMAAVSAGMLIYAACVEMIAGDFVMDSTLWKSSIRKQVLAVGSLIVGAGAMASVALWG